MLSHVHKFYFCWKAEIWNVINRERLSGEICFSVTKIRLQKLIKIRQNATIKSPSLCRVSSATYLGSNGMVIGLVFMGGDSCAEGCEFESHRCVRCIRSETLFPRIGKPIYQFICLTVVRSAEGDLEAILEGHLLGNRPVPVLRRRHRHREPRRRKRRRRRHVDKRQAAAPWRCRNVCTCNLLLK